MSQYAQHPEEGEWMAWIDGQLSPGETARMSNHCLNCRDCARTVSELQRAAAASARHANPLPAEFLRQSKAAFLAAIPKAEAAAVGSALVSPIASPSGLYTQLPRALWLASGLYFAVTFAAWVLWLSSGEWNYMTAAFGLPYKIFLGFAAAAGAALSYGASRQFEARHRLHSAWLLLGVASACRLLGTAAAAVPYLFPGNAFAALQGAGEFIAGPVALTALGFGLLDAYRAYRSAGLVAALTLTDWIVLGAGSLFTARHIAEVSGIVIAGVQKPALVMLNWLADPALLFVLAVAVPLRRIALAHNGNLVARCWAAMAAGVLLSFLSNLLLFFGNYGYLTWPLSSVYWLVWIPAYAAFTLGPAYQLAANGSPAAQPTLAAHSR